jgi:hypothetical protein
MTPSMLALENGNLRKRCLIQVSDVFLISLRKEARIKQYFIQQAVRG